MAFVKDSLKRRLKTSIPGLYPKIRKLYYILRPAYWKELYIGKAAELFFYGTILIYPLFALLSWVRILSIKLLRLKPSAVWGPTPIINIRDNSKVLQMLGYDSKTVVYSTYYITRDFDVVLEKYAHDPRFSPLVSHFVFLWALLRFDIFHYFYDGGLWSGARLGLCKKAARWELPLLRLAGKRVIAMAYGADVRVRKQNETWPVNICQECPAPTKNCICDDEAAANNISHYRQWANACIAMGDMLDFVEGSRNCFHWPIDTDAVPAVGVNEHNSPLKLVHSPNHPHFKGTRFIKQSVEELQAKGYSIQLVTIQGLSNEEAKRQYAEADIVIPQCICGWMGFTEIEAMAMGKPVIGYIRDPRYVAHAPGCPLVSAPPANLTAEMEKLVASYELRKELGQRGRKWVEDYWSYKAVAPHYERLHHEVWTENPLLRLIVGKLRRRFVGN